MAREKLCLGIDIGASGIKLCQLRRQRDEIALEHFAQRPLPPNAVLDGNIMNPAQVREVLDALAGGGAHDDGHRRAGGAHRHGRQGVRGSRTRPKMPKK